MRIGIVLPATPSYSETFFNNKIKGLESYGYEVILFVNNSSSNNSSLKTVHIASGFSGNKIKSIFFSIFSIFKLVIFHFSVFKRFYLLERADAISVFQVIKRCVLSHHILSYKLDWVHFGFGTMAIGRENVAAAIGAKMAVSFRGFDHYVYPVKNLDCYKLLFSKDVKYHVLSQEMKNDLIKLSIANDKIVKVTPAINTELFSNQSKFENKNKFLTIARLHWVKGLDYTLEALSILDKKGIDFHYSIIGEGIEREKLLFMSHQLGLEKKVTFCGKLGQDQIKDMLNESMYYIQYSLQEGFCNATLEAQAMGKICIVSDADGLIENVLNNETGFVIPKRNPQLLAAKIIEVLNLPEIEKTNISNNAINRVKLFFSNELQNNKFKRFYENS